MENCNYPVSDQLLVQFGQILPVLDQFLVQYGKLYLFQTKICPNWTNTWSEAGKLHFPISNLGIFLSAPKNFFECSFFSKRPCGSSCTIKDINYSLPANSKNNNSQAFFRFAWFVVAKRTFDLPL